MFHGEIPGFRIRHFERRQTQRPPGTGAADAILVGLINADEKNFTRLIGGMEGKNGLFEKHRKKVPGRTRFLKKFDPFLDPFLDPFFDVFLAILGAHPVLGYLKLGLARPDGLHWGYAPSSLTAVA